jgi:hypothetical protein
MAIKRRPLDSRGRAPGSGCGAIVGLVLAWSLTCGLLCSGSEVAAGVLPTSWRGAVLVFLEPGGRPGPGRVGFGALAGWTDVPRRFRNPRRTRAGVSRAGRAGFSQGRRRSLAKGRARRSWVCAARMSQVQRSAACGVRIFGAIQPRVCLNSWRVCSRSKRRKNDCQHRSISAAVAPAAEDHSHNGFGSRSPGRRSTWSRIRVPSMTGSAPSWASQQPRWVSRGWSGPSWKRSRFRSGWSR